MLVDERLMRGETLDFSQHMSLIVSMAQRFDGYMPRLMSGDPTFADKLKTVLVPLLDRFVVCDEGLDEHGRHLLRELFATGLLGAINAWMIDSDRMPIDQFVELIARTVLPESARSETCILISSDCPYSPPEKERNRG